MKRTRLALAGIALLSASALALAGCSNADSSSSSSGNADATAVVSVNGSEPENPLVPTNTNEVGGGKIIDSLFAGLSYYDGTGAQQNDMAESITVDSPTTITVTLKPGQTFSNGEAVTSDSFINAWNYGAKKSNAQKNASWFSDIVGFSEEADSELTGLAKVDDTSFTIELSSPVAADFVGRLGYSAYYPLPSAAFDDMAAFGENPIGNGPYKLSGDGAWQHDVEIDLVKNDAYTGGRQVQNGGLKIVFYASLDGAYSDLQAGNLDVLDAVPSASVATFQDELGDNAVNQSAAIFQSFTIPQTLAHFSGEEGQLRRAAISMAIDRDAITKTIFSGTRQPAKDFSAPIVEGWSDSLTGNDVLTYNPDEAKKLWAEADAISPWSGSFQIGYNADASHQAWVDAVSNSIKNTLAIDASGAPAVDFATFRSSITSRSITTAFRSGWQADYPALYNFLAPLYATGASSNDGDYSNAEVDALLAKGAAASTPAEAESDLQQAEEILLKDLPAIPLWYQNSSGGHSDAVSNVTLGCNPVPIYNENTRG